MTGRLFVAVVPPDPVRDALDRFLEPRRDAGGDLRWTLPEGWHLTCAFMAKVPPGLVGNLEDALAVVAARTAPFEIGIAGAGAFPNPDRARVLWLGVTRGAEELGRLARRCRNAAATSGIEVEGGPFRAHLTLARAAGIPATHWLEVLDAVPAQAWLVEGCTLIRSRTLPGGAGYQRLGEFRLTG
ncbi:MAG: RNA 2',3'-cyclic phosphodiesterase [Propionibacteriaceae bacterium]|nr:RNA 2',3'-cyclic phosphodiesterase [Propionibacteriaceae bacterium]